MAERSIARDCKSLAFGLRRFESCPAHKTLKASLRMLLVFVYIRGFEREKRLVHNIWDTGYPKWG